jgi:hypothetical protein
MGWSHNPGGEVTSYLQDINFLLRLLSLLHCKVIKSGKFIIANLLRENATCISKSEMWWMNCCKHKDIVQMVFELETNKTVRSFFCWMCCEWEIWWHLLFHRTLLYLRVHSRCWSLSSRASRCIRNLLISCRNSTMPIVSLSCLSSP